MFDCHINVLNRWLEKFLCVYELGRWRIVDNLGLVWLYIVVWILNFFFLLSMLEFYVGDRIIFNNLIKNYIYVNFGNMFYFFYENDKKGKIFVLTR